MPDPTESTLSAALAHERNGRFREALALYDRHLAVHPRNTVALHRSGCALLAAGDAVGAVHRLRAALALDAGLAPAWADLGRALAAIGRVEAAINAYAEASKRAPGDAALLADLAAAESMLGRSAQAERTARAALAVDSRHGSAWYQLALALEAQGRLLEALDAASRAAAVDPDAVANAGLKAQLELAAGQDSRAKATLDSALARKPLAAPLRFQLASLLEQGGDLPGAVAEYEKVLAIEPGNGAALSQLIVARKRMCDWHDLARLRAAFRQGVAEDRPLLSPFALLAEPSTRAEQHRCARRWVAVLAPPVAVEAPAPPRDPRARLRIGYLSADFHAHATATLVAGVVERHDRDRFAVAAYSTGLDDRSPMRARLVAAFDRFVDAREWSPQQLAAQVRADGIDVLVDLKGHTDDAARAASGARAGELARLPRHARRAVRRLRDRRRHRDAVRRSGRLQRSDRAATARVPAERRPRPRDRRAAVACGARAAGGRRRVLLLQCTVEAQSGSARPLDVDSANGSARRAMAARARRRSCHREPAPRSAGARHPAKATGVRRTATERRVSGTLPARRSVPRHMAVRRAHDGERCAVGGLSGHHLARTHVCEPRRSESVRHGRPAAARLRRCRRLLRARLHPCCRYDRARAASRLSRGSWPHEPAVRHGTLHRSARGSLPTDGRASASGRARGDRHRKVEQKVGSDSTFNRVVTR